MKVEDRNSGDARQKDRVGKSNHVVWVSKITDNFKNLVHVLQLGTDACKPKAIQYISHNQLSKPILVFM